MTVSDQHHASLAADSYRLDHRVGYHPPGNRDKVRMDGAVYEVVEFVDNKKTGYQGVIYQRIGTGEIVVRIGVLSLIASPSAMVSLRTAAWSRGKSIHRPRMPSR